LNATNFPSNEALFILHIQTPDCTLDGNYPLTGCEVPTTNKSFHLNFLDFGTSVKLKHFSRTGLTGNTPAHMKSSKNEPFILDPMVLEAVRIEF